MIKPCNVCNAVKIDNWEQVRYLAKNLPGWVYRGQREETWSLVPTLERYYINLNGKFSISEVEQHIISTFKRGSHTYLKEIPYSSDWLQWVSLIQHFGGPTRLLDFTKSIYVAAFFAFQESSVGDPAIWALNGIVLRGWLKSFIKEVNGHFPNYNSELDGAEVFNQLFEKIEKVEGFAVATALPFSMNERMTAQQGLFLFSLNMENSLENNLFGMFDMSSKEIQEHLSFGFYKGVEKHVLDRLRKTPIIKIILSKSMRKEVLQDLRLMNISHTTLFPGLDGFTKSLNHELIHLLK